MPQTRKQNCRWIRKKFDIERICFIRLMTNKNLCYHDMKSASKTHQTHVCSHLSWFHGFCEHFGLLNGLFHFCLVLSYQGSPVNDQSVHLFKKVGQVRWRHHWPFFGGLCTELHPVFDGKEELLLTCSQKITDQTFLQDNTQQTS